MVVPHGQDIISRRFRGGASWSGRHSMTLFSGSSWCCLIVRT